MPERAGLTKIKQWIDEYPHARWRWIAE